MVARIGNDRSPTLEHRQHLAEVLARAGIILVANPKAFLVELDPLLINLIEKHRALLPVADREALTLPVSGRRIAVQIQIS